MAADGGNKTVLIGSIKVGVISGDIITRQVIYIPNSNLF